MRQFYETYREQSNLSTLLREISWSAHLHILSGARSPEEREFYLRLAAENRWPVRELERQMDAGLYEKAILNPPKISTALRGLHLNAESCFKDSYSLEFYLEMLDRDVRKPHKNPSIGILLCATKDSEVVEYALSWMVNADD